MTSFKKVFTLIKREITSWLDNPTSYIALIVFVVLWQFLFFRNAFLIGEASLRNLYDLLPWLLFLFAAAVTMNTFSQEKQEGTLELLLTHPLKEIEVVLGKFKSSLLIIFFGLLFPLPIAFSFSLFGQIDFGVVFSQLLASLLLASALTSLGLFLSSLISHPTATLLATIAASFLLTIAGSEFITANLPLFLVPVFERLSFSPHFSSLTRGVLDLRDLWYFLSFTAVFLSLTYLQLIKRKYGNRQDLYRNFQIAVYLLTGIFILTNIVGNRLPGRLDLTRNKIYSLSSATKETLTHLPDIVTINFYASSKLPSQLIPIVREVKDILRDYQTTAKGNLQVTIKDPSGNPQIAQEAISKGIQEVQFNVIGQEEFQVKTGFVGLEISYAGKNEVIPFIQSTNDLEYQLTSSIVKLTTKDKKTVAFLSGHGEKNSRSEYKTFTQELEKQFKVQTLTLDEKENEINTENTVLIIAGPTSALDEKTQNAIKNYLSKKGNLFVLNDAYQINTQTLTTQKIENNLDKILSDLGVTLEKNIVYDLSAHETVRIGSGFFNLLVPYPFWPNAFPNPNVSFIQKIQKVVFPWPASLTPDEEKLKNQNYESLPLLSTTKYAGSQTGDSITLDPNKATFSKENLKTQLLSVALNPTKDDKGKIIIVADSDFLTEQFAPFSPENISFGVASVSWLAAEKSLADIKVKQANPPKLLFTQPYQPLAVKYGNLAFSVLVPLVIGVLRLTRRRKLSKQTYQTQK